MNNPLTYFNVTGKLTVRNLIFSGVNGLVAPDTSVDIDVSVLPQLYCTIPHEPNGALATTVEGATVSKTTLIEEFAKVDKEMDNFAFNCPFYSTSANKLEKPPTTWGSIDACR